MAHVLLPSMGLAQPGTLDLTFDPGANVTGQAFSVFRRADGVVFAAGNWNVVDQPDSYSVTKFDPGGLFDSSFHPYAPNATFVTLQPDGRPLVALSRYPFPADTTDRYSVARLKATGELDRTFAVSPGALPLGSVAAIAVQPDAKIVIGGSFTNINNVKRRAIARLNPDGSLDNTFAVGDGANFRVYALAIQPDRKIVVGGDFASIAGAQRSGIARLNPDGSPDSGFDPGWGADDAVRTVALQPDGKILIAGSFSTVNLAPRTRIARLNPDGSVDADFDPLLGADGDILTIGYQADGKIVVGGTFTKFNDVTRVGLARLNADGSLDTSFETSSGLWGVQSLAIQPEGSVIIGGPFKAVGGVARPGIARLNGNIEAPVSPSIVTQPRKREVARGTDVSFTAKATGTIPLFYQWRKNGEDLAGATNVTLLITNSQPSDAGAYAVSVRNAAGSASSDAVALIVDGRPVIVAQSQDQAASEGSQVTFEVEAAGPGPLSYQWRKDGIPLADGGGISGAKASRLTLAGVATANQGNYSMVVENSFGSVTSRTAKLVVYPANDSFSLAQPLPALGGRFFANSQFATKEPDEPEHAGNAGGKSIWFAWTVPFNGHAVVDTIGSEIDTILAVYTGASVGALTLVAADDDGANFKRNSRLVFPVTAGTAYRIAVDGYGGTGGAVEFNASFEEPVLGLPTVVANAPAKLLLRCLPRSVVVVEASEDLRTWVPVSTNQASDTGLVSFQDSGPVSPSRRFYRAAGL